MKGLSKGLTAREKTLLCILILIIMGAAYYFLVQQPISERQKLANERITTIEDELLVVNAKAQKIANMKEEIAELEKNGQSLTLMPSYNSSKKEIEFLHEILSSQTLDYIISFTESTRMGNQIRRNFSLQFTANDYGEAKEIVDALEKSEIRCLISDFNMVPVENDADIFSGQVDVNCIATFYETMYGGKADSDLPEDSTPQEADTEVQE